MYELKKPVALVGMMGSGKSAVGKAVSSALSVPFNDADDEIEHAARLSIPEIFERHGEKFFRDKENQRKSSCYSLIKRTTKYFSNWRRRFYK